MSAQRQMMDPDRREFDMNDADFQAISDLLYRRAGIVLGDHKRELVYARLARRLRTLGLGDFQSYRAVLESESGQNEQNVLINALTTNHTRFFRESHHFDYLANSLVPLWLNEIRMGRRKRVRIWSAGCSSGEEPYSIALVLARFRDLMSRADVKILATDIDTQVLATARAGLYPANAETTLDAPAQKRVEHVGGQIGMPELERGLITFNKLNLHGPWPMKGLFDVIFCRNVTIYFDTPTKTRLLQRFHDQLTPSGLLFMGHSESLVSGETGFVSAGRTVYRRREAD
ncbi:CheR family methyltransferase [Maricaulis sp. D1M11]|uniref:CheR family methyltransferase n=1 Tax=Maricaulis sp. D1M11 TaxID=3076117 RepID=UPI0039B41011